jgi:probable rRNA maturation factor
VLSFPFATAPVLVGEVLLSADTARREAAARGHCAYHELLLYAVHGVLHLLGYDDHDPAGRRRMRRAERAALAALGIPPVFGRR